MRAVLLCLPVLLAALAAPAAPAQQLPRPGARFRIDVPVERTHVGTLIALESTTPVPQRDTVLQRLRSIERLDIHTGRTSAAGHRAVTGSFAGVAVATFVATTLAAYARLGGFVYVDPQAVPLALVPCDGAGPYVGAFLDSALGTACSETVPVRPPRIGTAPVPERRFGMGLRPTF